MKLKMLNGYVAVSFDLKRTTASGIILSSLTKSERPVVGQVKFVNEAETRFKVGDLVTFLGWYEPTKIEEDEYFFVNGDDITSIVNDD